MPGRSTAVSLTIVAFTAASLLLGLTASCALAGPVNETREVPAAPAAGGPVTRSMAFYANWDPASVASLAEHHEDVTVLAPVWLCWAADGTLVHDNVYAERRIKSFLASNAPEIALEPVVVNWDPGSGWDPIPLAETLADSQHRESLAASITAEALAGGWDGVNIDFEGLPATSKDDLSSFMRALYARLHPLGLEVSIDVGIADAACDRVALADAADFIVPMFYDEHWSTSPHGSIAGQPWFSSELARLLRAVPPEKVVVGLGNYGYRWAAGAPPAAMLTYANALSTAARAGQTISFDPTTLNPRFACGTDQIWFLDAATAFNQVSVSSAYGVGGYAVWRMGMEDPALWKVMHARDSLSASVAGALNDASRTVTYDPERRLITAETIVPSLTATQAAATALTLLGPATCTYRSATLTGVLSGDTGPLSGQRIRLESSPDGVVWTGQSEGVSGPGGFKFAVTPTARTYYRAVYDGDLRHGRAMSAVLAVTPGAAMGAPKSPKLVRRGGRFTVTGSLAPSKAGACAVVHLYRWQKRRWRLKATVTAVAVPGGYRARVKGLDSGKWRIRARFAGDVRNAPSWSPVRALRVR